jgi:predicted amidohydrolase
LAFVGNSVIVAPTGEVLARASETQSEFIFADIDVYGDLMKEAVSQNPYLLDRRPELYSALLN